MQGEERRNRLLQILTQSKHPISGTTLAKELQVSRQVIVQDIALLRANGTEIFSASRGYLLPQAGCKRIFKVFHSDEEAEEELTSIVDLGGRVEDVFIYHKVYGVVRADMNIRSRIDIRRFISDIQSGRSSLLKNVTGGYHYHTVLADDGQTLDAVQEALQKKGMLAPLQDYEPVDFWNHANGPAPTPFPHS